MSTLLSCSSGRIGRQEQHQGKTEGWACSCISSCRRQGGVPLLIHHHWVNLLRVQRTGMRVATNQLKLSQHASVQPG